MGRQLIVFFLLSSLLSACDFLDLKGIIVTYTDVDERFDASMQWNAIEGLPIQKTRGDDYTFYMVSDCHLGGTKNINKMYTNAMADSADGVFMIGDNCNGNLTDYDTLAAVIKKYEVLTSYMIVGNHDLFFKGWKHFYSYFGSSTYYLTVSTPVAEDLFIILDTGGATLGELQLQWFKDVLSSQRHNFRNCIVLTHNNILLSRHTISTLPMTEEVHVLLDLFLKYDVNYCIAGHDHRYDQFVFGNTHYIVTDALLDDNKKASYLKLNIKDGTISVSRHPISE